MWIIVLYYIAIFSFCLAFIHANIKMDQQRRKQIVLVLVPGTCTRTCATKQKNPVLPQTVRTTNNVPRIPNTTLFQKS